jgi:hypothetical protein
VIGCDRMQRDKHDCNISVELMQPNKLLIHIVCVCSCFVHSLVQAAATANAAASLALTNVGNRRPDAPVRREGGNVVVCAFVICVCVCV